MSDFFSFIVIVAGTLQTQTKCVNIQELSSSWDGRPWPQ